MRKTVAFTLRLDKELVLLLRKFCKINGYKINRFIEKAIIHEIEKRELEKFSEQTRKENDLINR